MSRRNPQYSSSSRCPVDLEVQKVEPFARGGGGGFAIVHILLNERYQGWMRDEKGELFGPRLSVYENMPYLVEGLIVGLTSPLEHEVAGHGEFRPQAWPMMAYRAMA